MTAEFARTSQTKMNRKPARGAYDEETIHAILDDAIFCQVAFIVDGRPFVIPSNFGRIDNTIYLHGAKASRLMKVIASGEAICIGVTHLDGLVLARSLFSHSVNYRSAVLFGHGRLVTELAEQMEALKAVTDQLLPGRWDEARKPSQKEIDSTAIVAFEIEEASAKSRQGGVLDEPEDMELPVWAGVVEMAQIPMKILPESGLPESVEIAPSVAKWFGNAVGH